MSAIKDAAFRASKSAMGALCIEGLKLAAIVVSCWAIVIIMAALVSA